MALRPLLGRALGAVVLTESAFAAHAANSLRLEEAETGARLAWQGELKRAADAAGANDAKVRALIAGIYVAGLDGVCAVLGECSVVAK